MRGRDNKTQSQSIPARRSACWQLSCFFRTTVILRLLIHPQAKTWCPCPWPWANRWSTGSFILGRTNRDGFIVWHDSRKHVEQIHSGRRFRGGRRKEPRSGAGAGSRVPSRENAPPAVAVVARHQTTATAIDERAEPRQRFE